jgi:hypothetical protein
MHSTPPWTALDTPPALAAAFVRAQQGALLDAIHGQPKDDQPWCDYGFVLCRRRERGRWVFGVLTPAGESTPLTERLLFTLGFERCRLRGGKGIVLLPAPPVADGADAPLEELWVELTGRGAADEVVGLVGEATQRRGRVGTVVRASEYERTTIVLTQRQPLGWPV